MLPRPTLRAAGVLTARAPLQVVERHNKPEVEVGCTSARGTLVEVIYLGAVNHYLVELDAGPTLTVLRQNLREGTDRAMDQRGRPVTIGWADEHVIDLSGPAKQLSGQPKEKEMS